MSAERAFTKRAKINKRLSVEITVGSSGVTCIEWDPELPAPKSLTRSELKRYFRVRDATFAEWGKAMGKGVIVADTNGRIRAIGPDGSIEIIN